MIRLALIAFGFILVFASHGRAYALTPCSALSQSFTLSIGIADYTLSEDAKATLKQALANAKASSHCQVERVNVRSFAGEDRSHANWQLSLVGAELVRAGISIEKAAFRIDGSNNVAWRDRIDIEISVASAASDHKP